MLRHERQVTVTTLITVWDKVGLTLLGEKIRKRYNSRTLWGLGVCGLIRIR